MVKKHILNLILLLTIFFQATPAEAQYCNATNCANGTCYGGYCISQPPGLRPDISGPGAAAGLVSRFFIFILPLAGVIGFIFLLWSGFQFLTSKGDPKSLAAAQGRLTYTIIGLVVIFLAYSLTLLFTNIFNIKMP